MNENSPELEAAAKAAANIVLGSIADLLYVDAHSWSERPCATCRTITGILGRPFGCNRYAIEKAARRAAQQEPRR